MAYETLSQQPAFPGTAALYSAAQGRVPYPWAPEALAAAPPAWAASPLRPVLERCLVEEPAARVTATQLLAALSALSLTSAV